MLAKSILLVMSGALTGITFVISCGDNWRPATEAAIDAPTVTDAPTVCDCPAAEPPLAGRFVWSSGYIDLQANARHSARVFCPVGMQLIWGSCTIVNVTTTTDVTLKQSGFLDDPPTGWRCSYQNNDPVMYLGEVAVLCLRQRHERGPNRLGLATKLCGQNASDARATSSPASPRR
jgi:hypothetical protein